MRLISAVVLCAVAMLAPPAMAQTYPVAPVKLIVTTGAGGALASGAAATAEGAPAGRATASRAAGALPAT